MEILELEKTSSSSNLLPLEIIEIILSKLPAQSLLRFKTVSKSWNAMISDPVFVETHLKSSNSPSDLLFVCGRKDTEKGFSMVTLEGEKGFSMVKLEGENFHEQAVLDIPNGFVKILCECNGVLLLTTVKYPLLGSNYLLWNPSTRRGRYLICPYDDEQGSSVLPGTCYDPITDDFKVVLISNMYYTIYSCKNDSWTRKEGGFRNNALGDSGIFFDGAIYWVFLWTKTSTTKLVYFDPKTDELKRMHDLERLGDGYYSRFVCLKGSLCLSGNVIRDAKDGIKHRIWMREKGNVGENPSWKELITFENVPLWFLTFKPMCFVEDKILVYNSYLGYAYYSPSEKRYERFGVNCEKIVQYRNSLYGTKMLANL